MQHMTTQLTFRYRHEYHITLSKKEYEIKSWKIFDLVYKFVASMVQ